ncbi:hypothetical protein [Aeromicrobium stalagmiti]|uniref:hypothetical protein n=1 Tax=Aeromicrobium stalagmiti TaxID=2738988 RepID=UPI00156854EA|nr:hypothetical protein [Aeromicrobium stalagmiti]NRQ49629.1 hypothetical protein [Aeromicrobium stalagmiti]
MTYVVVTLLGLVMTVLVVGALTGRVRLTACCSVADPRRDLRMRGAFDDEVPS